MADLKITELTEETTLASGDMIPIVTDIDTTAVTKKVSLENIKKVVTDFLVNQVFS